MSAPTVVTTQAELDAAVAADAPRIHIDAGTELVIGGSAHVDWIGGSAHVNRICDTAHVDRIGGSAHVNWICDTARVNWICDTAVAHLHGRATIGAAGSHAVVFRHSPDATVTVGIVIDLTAVDLTDARQWCAHHAVSTLTPLDGPFAGVEVAVLVKVTNDDLRSGRGFHYPVGALVAADDWRDDHDCGGGLHFSPSPLEAWDYHAAAVRALECHIPLTELRPIPGAGAAKVKAPRAHVAREISDPWGRPRR